MACASFLSTLGGDKLFSSPAYVAVFVTQCVMFLSAVVFLPDICDNMIRDTKGGVINH